LIAVFTGCQSMTELKMQQVTTELEKMLQVVRAERNAYLADEEKKVAEENARIERSEKLITASERLEAGDPKGALLVLDGVLLQPPAPPPTEKAPPPENGATPEATTPPADTVPAAKDPPQSAPESEIVPPLDPAEKAKFLALKGVALSELGKRDEGIEELRAALALDPSNRDARRNLGRLLSEMGKHREALLALGPELADGWRDAQLLSLVGRSRHEVGRSGGSAQDLEAARFAFQQVIVEHPDDMDAMRSLAMIEFETERYSEAARHMDALRRENPLDPDLLEKLGRCHLALGEPARGLDYLELAANLKPPTQDLSLTIASLHERLGYPGKAAEWLDRAYRSMPEEAPVVERPRVGRLFFDAGRPEDALRWLSAVGEGDPQFTNAQAVLVRLHAADGKDAEALSAYEKVKGSPLEEGAVHLAAGLLYLKGRQLEKAADAYARASAVARTKAEGLAGLAEVLIARGDPAGALEAYRKVLDLKPADARALATVESLRQDLDRKAWSRSAISHAAPADGKGTAGGPGPP
jgi:tetratricopeptide (TPR) repeat protein